MKRIIIPIALCAIIIIAAISTCVGGSSKVELSWAGHEPESERVNDSMPERINDSIEIELKVYVENSGSMDAYMCAGSDLKDAVFDYVSDLKRLATLCSFYYINSKVIPYTGGLNSYIKDLTPQSFAKAGGSRANTDLRQILDTIVKANGPNTVSVFVSDCILDIPQNAIDFLGNCQVSIKNTFNEALAANPNLGVEIMKLESKFDGWWYCGHNKEYLKDVKRPYYIWVIGDQRLLAELNMKVPVEDIIGGIKEYCAYSAHQAIPFDIPKSTYVINHSGKINVELLVNLRGSLQQKKELYKDLKRYKASVGSIVSVKEITAENSKYSHVIDVEIENPATVKSETITFSYPDIATWVATSDDTIGKNVKDNLDKTTGLMALVKGVAEAYKAPTDSIVYGSVSFEIKNK